LHCKCSLFVGMSGFKNRFYTFKMRPKAISGIFCHFMK
jgi:hypothetical protein